VRVSALHVGAGAPVAEVVAAHLDDEVIVPPALAVVGVLRAAAAAAAPVSASAAAAAPVAASAAAAAPVSASAAARRAGAGAGRGARRGGGRGEAALARRERRRRREVWGGGIGRGGGISRGRDGIGAGGVRAGDVGGGIRDFGGSHGGRGRQPDKTGCLRGKRIRCTAPVNSVLNSSFRCCSI
jgi:hypothetical protein